MPPVVNVTQTTIARTDAVPSILLPQQRPAPGRVTQERLQRLFAAHADQLGFDAREAPELAKALLGVMAQTQSIFDSDALRRADAATDTAFLSRQLLYIDPTKYQVKYPDVRWRDLVPVKTDVPSGADSFSTEMFDEISDSGNTAAGAGANADGEDYSDSASMTEIQGSETIGKIRPLIKAYGYSLQDLRKAAFGGVPLDVMKAQATRRAMERRMDYLACVGDARYPSGDSRKTGLANDPNLSATTKGTQASGTTWATATADEILADVTSMWNKVFNGTKGTHMPNAFYVGTSGFGILKTKRLDSFNRITVAQYILETLPIDRIEHWPRLNTAGASSKERILMGELNRENFEFVLSQDFEQFAPQLRGLMYLVYCHMRSGGYAMRRPLSWTYMDGTAP